MFFTFLNKDNSNCPHISVLSNYYPEEFLFYHYNSIIRIPWESYEELKELVMTSRDNLAGQKWLELMENEIAAATDLDNLKNNEYINTIGPYYYSPGNIRFYFTKDTPAPSETILAEDLTIIYGLATTPEIDKELQAYHKSRKNNRKNPKNKEELIKDINMCLKSLRAIEILNKHINYLNKILEQRYALIEEKKLILPEPDTLPSKPQKGNNPEQPVDNLIPFSLFKNRTKKQEKPPANNFNHEMKVYYIRYREYEKACDRYKKALENWHQDYADLMEHCSKDIEICGTKLNNARKILETYNKILLKSFVHADYQDLESLEIFRYYLETGRAQDIQSCMNLFEEERHWMEIKASQERIENTIYFLQNENTDTLFADEHINQLLKRVNDKPAALVRA